MIIRSVIVNMDINADVKMGYDISERKYRIRLATLHHRSCSAVLLITCDTNMNKYRAG